MTTLADIVVKATPGPWSEGVSGNNRVYGPDCAGEHSGLVAVTYKEPANRSLIALAPTLAALVLEAREALAALTFAEADYRAAHDLYGDGSREAGRAWDLMRRAGDRARATLAKLEAL